jgi:hypothetical protein
MDLINRRKKCRGEIEDESSPCLELSLFFFLPWNLIVAACNTNLKF